MSLHGTQPPRAAHALYDHDQNILYALVMICRPSNNQLSISCRPLPSLQSFFLGSAAVRLDHDANINHNGNLTRGFEGRTGRLPAPRDPPEPMADCIQEIHHHPEPPNQRALFLCFFVLGAGFLAPYNSMLTAVDFFRDEFDSGIE